MSSAIMLLLSVAASAVPEHAWHCEMFAGYRGVSDGRFSPFQTVTKITIDPKNGTYSRQRRGESYGVAYSAQVVLFSDHLIAHTDRAGFSATVSPTGEVSETYSYNGQVQISYGQCQDVVPAPVIRSVPRK